MRTGQPAKFILLFTLLFTITGISPATAQQFAWQAALPAVSESGFYNIVLSPAFVAKSSSTALADVRIFDGETAVSYILRENNKYVVLPSPVITATNDASSRRTTIQLHFQDAYLVQQLQLKVNTPTFYKRNLHIRQDSFTCIQEGFTIISGQPATLQLFIPLKAKWSSIIIENEDNPPLKITGVTALQKQLHLTAWLEKGKSYLLKTGDSSLPPPVYDLPYFANKLPEKIPAIEAGNIKAIPAVIKNEPSQANETSSTIFKSKIWIWIGIGCIIALISLLTIRLLRDMRERK